MTPFPRFDSSSVASVSMTMLNIVGLAGPPCVTPLSILLCFLDSSPIVRTYRVWRIRDIIAMRLQGNTFLHRSINKSRRKMSYAKFRSRTAVHLRPPLIRCSICALAISVPSFALCERFFLFQYQLCPPTRGASNCSIALRERPKRSKPERHAFHKNSPGGANKVC